MSIAHYGPSLLAFWKEASLSPKELIIKERKTAVHLRHRLYRLRKELQKEDPDFYRLAARVSLRIEPFTENGVTTYKLIAAHADEEFEKILGGFKEPEPPELD